MTSVTVDPIAEGIKDVAAGLTGLSGAITVKGYKWAPPGALDALPACVVYVPAIERTDVGPDRPEDHLGARDWFLDYPVTFYFAADDLASAQAQIAEVIEAFVTAIDESMDPGKPLNGALDDVKVIRVSEPGEGTTPSNRTVWVVETRVSVVKFVNN